MNSLKFYVYGQSKALEYATAALQNKGCQVSLLLDPSVTHLLLDVPSFSDNGMLRSGEAIDKILHVLPADVVIIGGNLNHPALEGYTTVDLLRDPLYLAENALITAHCAIKLALNRLPTTLYNQSVLVVGWGRIGKCIASLLRCMGARVSVAVRSESDRAILNALGFDAIDTAVQGYELVRFRVLFNTAPEMVFDKEALQYCREDCLKIDLASRPGLEGSDILWARGLPGKDAPEASGELIAKTVLRLR